MALDESKRGVDEGASLVPSPETLFRDQLKKAPRGIRRITSTLLSLINWVGLPSTLLSILTDLKWVVDLAGWVYRNSGIFAHALGLAGSALHWVAEAWRGLTHPIWAALFSWLGVALPPWAADPLTLATLLLAGLSGWRHRFRLQRGRSRRAMRAAVLPKGETREGYVRIPLRFPYKELWSPYIKWTPRRLALTKRFWRRWRRFIVERSILYDDDWGPRFPEPLIHNAFRDAWVGLIWGRDHMRLYVFIALIAGALFAIDWAYSSPK